MTVNRISVVSVLEHDTSTLIKHPLHPWPTSALISLLDIFSFLICSRRPRTIIYIEYKEKLQKRPLGFSAIVHSSLNG